MYILEAAMDRYIEENCTPEDPVLEQLNRETHLQVMQPRMLSGKVQGKFLEFLSIMIRPKRILEIGTYTGYSAISLAKGLVQGGKLFTIDINDELNLMVNKYLEAADKKHIVETIIGDASEIIPNLEGPFDIVFIDADKKNYSNYFDLVFDQVSPGGWIIADNVLWSGKVADTTISDKDTDALRAYNRKIQNDSRVENVIASVRDGLSIARKIG